MQITQSELARIWDRSRQYVAKLVKAGMPLTSEEAAVDWLKINYPKSPVLNKYQPSQEPVDQPKILVDKPDNLVDISLEGLLSRSQVNELEAYALLEQAMVDKDVNKLERLIKAHEATSMARLKIENQIIELKQRYEVLITVDEAKSLINRELGNLVRNLKNMPKHLSGRMVNLTREEAQVTLEEFLAKLLKENYES